MQECKILCLLLFTITMSSCGKEFSDEVVGTWKLNNVHINECPEENYSDTTVFSNDGCMPLFGEETCLSYQFLESGEGTIFQEVEGSPENMAFSYTSNNETKTVNVCVDGNCYDMNFIEESLSWQIEEDPCEIYFNFIKEQ